MNNNGKKPRGRARYADSPNSKSSEEDGQITDTTSSSQSRHSSTAGAPVGSQPGAAPPSYPGYPYGSFPGYPAYPGYPTYPGYPSGYPVPGYPGYPPQYPQQPYPPPQQSYPPPPGSSSGKEKSATSAASASRFDPYKRSSQPEARQKTEPSKATSTYGEWKARQQGAASGGVGGQATNRPAPPPEPRIREPSREARPNETYGEYRARQQREKEQREKQQLENASRIERDRSRVETDTRGPSREERERRDPSRDDRNGRGRDPSNNGRGGYGGGQSYGDHRRQNNNGRNRHDRMETDSVGSRDDNRYGRGDAGQFEGATNDDWDNPAFRPPAPPAKVKPEPSSDSEDDVPMETDTAGSQTETTTSNNESSNGSRPVGRGGARGRRVQEIILTRPEHATLKRGTSGRKVKLQANYFRLAVDPSSKFIVYQYRVDFKVQEEATIIRKAWIREHRDKLGKNYLFDGSLLFTTNRLTVGREVLKLKSIRRSDNAEVPIEIKLVQKLKYPHPVYLQIFNVLVRRCLEHLKLQQIRRNYFDPQGKVELRQYNIELWPGYVTSIKQHEDDILMVAEITHKVMRTDTVADLLKDTVRAHGRDWQKAFTAAVLGQIVLTDYNNRTYRVDDVMLDLTPSSSFEKKNKESITYMEYYQNRYGIRIRDARQPLLLSRPTVKDIRGGNKTPILLIPELCRLTGLDDQMRENHQLMRAMADYTRVNPEGRIEKLLAFNRRLQSQPAIAAELQDWNLGLSKNLVEVEGRILPTENIIAANRETYSAGQQTDWTRELRAKPMLYNAPFNSFAVVVPENFARDAENFLRTLKNAANGMRFNIPQHEVVRIQSDRVPDVVNGIESYLGRHGNPSLMMFFCSNNQSARYNAIKKKCCVDRAIPSQVVLKKSMFNKGVMSIATKIAIQLNCKLGGAPWSVSVPAKDGFMIVGYDCSRDPNSKGKSWGAVVATLNKAMNLWFSTVSHHPNNEEISNHISSDIGLALKKYFELNGALPGKIVIYRDGVGDGDLPRVFNYEVKMIKRRLTEIYKGETWKMAFIVVTKKLNTRLFANGRNPSPGTVVDDVITCPEKYDFFLVSQSVRQGTVSPTCYNIISDNLGWSIDNIQQLSYKMTHLYYNWSGTVRVPAPCQYAHKLSFLVSQTLNQEPNVDLCTKLFFL